MSDPCEVFKAKFDAQQYDVGERWVTANVRAHYFADLCSHYATKQKYFTWAVLIFSSGATGTLLSKLPPKLAFLPYVLAVFTTAISLFSVVQRYNDTATDCSDLHASFNRLATEYNLLRHDMDAADALERLKTLIAKGEEISKRTAKIPYQQKRMLKWQHHVQAQNR